MNINGYETFTDFYSDFDIAERCGVTALSNSFMINFEQGKNDFKKLAELYYVLYKKMEEAKEKGDQELFNWYADHWCKVDQWGEENLHGAQKNYYYRVTDGDFKMANYYLSIV